MILESGFHHIYKELCKQVLTLKTNPQKTHTLPLYKYIEFFSNSPNLAQKKLLSSKLKILSKNKVYTFCSGIASRVKNFVKSLKLTKPKNTFGEFKTSSEIYLEHYQNHFHNRLELDEFKSLLKEGIKDFSETNLSGIDLSNMDLSDLNFSNANLENANLENSCLSETNFTKANLSGANLTKTSLGKAILKKTNLKNVYGFNQKKFIYETDQIKRRELQSRLPGGNIGFYREDLSGMNLSNMDLSGVNFQEANFEGCNLIGSKLINSNLRNANLKNAILRSCNLKGADLTGTDLKTTDLKNAILENAIGINGRCITITATYG